MVAHGVALTSAGYDHPDAVRLIAELQAVYVARYGGVDATPLDPTEFAAPGGYFVLGYVHGAAAACGGWRARDSDPGEPELRRGGPGRLPARADQLFGEAVVGAHHSPLRRPGRVRPVLKVSCRA